MGLFYSVKNFDKINVIGKIYKVNIRFFAFQDKGLNSDRIEPKEPFIFLGNDTADEEFSSKKILYKGKIYWVDNVCFSPQQYLEVLE